MKRLFLALAAAFGAMTLEAAPCDTISLAGMWRFQLDPMSFGKTPGSELYLTRLTETIRLPGSTDEGGKGIQNTASHVDRLSRKFEYCGPAWYQREVDIPDGWAGQRIEMELERCHWETTVYVDGVLVGTGERLSTPNRFVLSDRLTPGTHTITLCVDNRLKYPMDQWAHGTTEYTQTNWNGVAGRMILTATPAFHIDKVRIYPDIKEKKAGVVVDLSGKGEGNISLRATDRSGNTVAAAEKHITCATDSISVTMDLTLGKSMKLWDEFNPNLYTLEVTLSTAEGDQRLSETFGMRSVTQGRHHIQVNGIDRHLRGTLDCAVFPLTGYPSTDRADWTCIMSTVKDYGMNHIRFHSWCPPEAAFEAADRLGIYLQVELPMWIKDVGKYPSRRDFFEKEMYAILDEYGNHPSFVLYCNGNENEGDFSVLEDLIVKGKAHDPRHLYSASTARTHVKSDQFFTSHITSSGWITVYEGTPSTDWDRNAESDIDVPVIAHESGQRCMYPDFNEINKYTGVLEARNLNVFRERLTRNGMLAQAHDFFKATGAHTVLQYKEVNEALLRTSKSGGFQLLGLADFPGQGSAFVGILDPFWESKSLVSPEKFRESCAPTVLLARMPRRIYTDTDTFSVKIGIYHFGEKDMRPGNVTWTLHERKSGRTVREGKLRHGLIPRSSTDSIGQIDISLDGLEAPAAYTLRTKAGPGENAVRNEWDIWVYPQDTSTFGKTTDGPLAATSWEEARKALNQGKDVLLITGDVPGRKTKFASHFWNPIMFNWDPMIVGTLIDATHPAFSGFPTDSYADWQWYDILNHATALDLTALRDVTPVIQSIDTYEENRKLGIAFEVKAGKGKLFVLALDTAKDMEQRPASRQLVASVSEYVRSREFNPEVTVPLYMLDAVFTPEKRSGEQSGGSEAIEQLLNR